MSHHKQQFCSLAMKKRKQKIHIPNALTLQKSISQKSTDTLMDRREVLTERFFKRHVLPSSSLLHYRRDYDTVNSLRH